MEVSKLNGVVTYVIKGLAFVGGVGQVAMGLPLIFAPGINGMGGAVFGVALVAHGANNIYMRAFVFLPVLKIQLVT